MREYLRDAWHQHDIEHFARDLTRRPGFANPCACRAIPLFWRCVRYFKVNLLVGFLTALLVAVLFELGSFRHLDQGLANFLGVRLAPVTPRLPQYALIVLLSFGLA